MSRKKTDQATEIVADENVATSRPAKKKNTAGLTMVTIDIRSKQDHAGYLKWSIELLPDIYTPEVKTTETGYQVTVSFFSVGQVNEYFICRYLAKLVIELRTLDESNLRVEYKVPVKEPEVAG